MFRLPLSHLQTLIKYRSKVNKCSYCILGSQPLTLGSILVVKSTVSADFIIYTIDYGLKN